MIVGREVIQTVKWVFQVIDRVRHLLFDFVDEAVLFFQDFVDE